MGREASDVISDHLTSIAPRPRRRGIRTRIHGMATISARSSRKLLSSRRVMESLAGYCTALDVITRHVMALSLIHI